MTTLKLARLTDRTPVKLTIAVPAALHQDLCDCAAMYRDRYGGTEAVADLVPAMLAAFLASDRAFTRRLKGHRPCSPVERKTSVPGRSASRFRRLSG